MNRLVAILLIPFFVMGNSSAHAHGIAAHPSQDQARPHIHLGSGSNHDHHHADDHHGHAHGSHRHSHQGHSRHGHSHQAHHHDQGLDHIPDQNGDGDNSDSKSIAPVEHDSDAVYLIAADSLFVTSARGTLELSSQCFPALGFPATGTSFVFANRRPQLVFARPPSCTAGLPLYLLHAALRI